MILKKHAGLILIVSIFISLMLVIKNFLDFKSENNESIYDEIILSNQIDFDLDKIKKRGKLKILTENNSICYFIYKGSPMGFDYELLNEFAKHLGVEIEVHVAKDLNAMFKQLARGEIDIIAANISVTKDRKDKIGFSKTLLKTHQILVQRKYDLSNNDQALEIIDDVNQLSGKKIHIRKNSAQYSRLKNLNKEIDGEIEIIEVAGDIDNEKLISMVSTGEIDYTIVNDNLAKVNQVFYNNLDISLPISSTQNIAWAVRKNAPQLKNELNNWLDKKLKSNSFAAIETRYFKVGPANRERRKSEYFSNNGIRISEFDDLLKKHSETINWDWKLLAAMIYQESKFNHDAVSVKGAAGIMQIMPETAMALGIDTLQEYVTVEESLRAGVKYIKKMDKYWSEFIEDDKERIKFILASYNVGLGHVKDAQRLALKNGKSDIIWNDNVAYYLLKKSESEFYNDPVVKHGYCRGSEPLRYVNQILSRYRDYVNVFGEEEIILVEKID
jgi:membrane-bound lytic murein transglycosylase F